MNPLDVKGCGEAGAVAAPPAVINAIAIGHGNIAMPATPQKSLVGPTRTSKRMAAE
jgi:carbon-monoxide dehydrogenase large subunit